MGCHATGEWGQRLYGASGQGDRYPAQGSFTIPFSVYCGGMSHSPESPIPLIEMTNYFYLSPVVGRDDAGVRCHQPPPL